ncbi:MAG TPA: CDP-alcohol phosphatidyltransferase family protein, partial [Thermopolyspora sp.]
PPAVAAMLLLALRHVIDFSYAGAVADGARVGSAWNRPVRSLYLPYDARTTMPDPGGVPTSTDAAHGAHYWLRKVIILPIGERTALICLTAALFDARVTFLALLGWGGVAALYTLAGRVGRSLR